MRKLRSEHGGRALPIRPTRRARRQPSTGEAELLLDGDPSTQANKGLVVTADGKLLRRPVGKGVGFSADGIALSQDGIYRYWQAIKDDTLYRITTSALTDAGWRGADISAQVQAYGKNGFQDSTFFKPGAPIALPTSLWRLREGK